MTDARQQLGLAGEQLAERHLRGKGFKTIARRYRTSTGEIDMIMRDGDTTVFVEVKTQQDRVRLDPELRVNAAKQRKLAITARIWLKKKRLEHKPVRFDIVGVIIPETGPSSVQHYPEAFVPPRW